MSVLTFEKNSVLYSLEVVVPKVVFAFALGVILTIFAFYWVGYQPPSGSSQAANKEPLAVERVGLIREEVGKPKPQAANARKAQSHFREVGKYETDKSITRAVCDTVNNRLIYTIEAATTKGVGISVTNMPCNQ